MNRTHQLIKKQMKKRGFVAPFIEFLAKEDPEYLELYMNFVGTLLEQRHYALSRKMKELLIIALDASRLMEVGLRLHIERALKDRIATKQEILETLEVAGVPTGFVTSIFGVTVLEQVLNENSRRTKPKAH